MVELTNDEDEILIESIRWIVCLVPLQITAQTRWSPYSRTVAGDHSPGDALNQLHSPRGLDLDVDGSLLIADTYNHRIARWRPNARQGEIVVGSKQSGNRTDQLSAHVAMLLDRINRSLIIIKGRNRRGTRWRQGGDEGEVIIPNVESSGLTIDEDGFLMPLITREWYLCRPDGFRVSCRSRKSSIDALDERCPGRSSAAGWQW